MLGLASIFNREEALPTSTPPPPVIVNPTSIKIRAKNTVQFDLSQKRYNTTYKACSITNGGSTHHVLQY